jgi:sensor histidine kinase YesM
MASEMRVKMRKIDGNIVVNIEAEDSGTGMHPKTSQEMEQLRGQALNR